MEAPPTLDDPGMGPGARAQTLGHLMDALVKVEASISTLMAARTELLESVRVWSELTEAESPNSSPGSRELAFRSVRAEVACALRVPERTVENLFGIARRVLRDMPATMGALREGEISYRHVQTIVEHAAGLSGDKLAAFERLVVPAAASSTVAGLQRKARRLREGIDPAGLEQRTREAADKREVSWMPGQDGRGVLCIDLSVVDGAAIYTRATDVARALVQAERGTAGARTLMQARVDVMRDALMTGTFDALGGKLVRPDVFVTVPVFSLMGVTDEPGDLSGYGPIDADTARRLAANAPSFVRLLVHPFTGAILGRDRERYAIPADLKTAVRVRHETCGMLGCNQPAQRCDIDHTVDWQHDGKTRLNNLAPRCRGHHTLKHHTPWKVTQDPDGSGTLTWTSPAGKIYLTQPDNRARPPDIPPF